MIEGKNKSKQKGLPPADAGLSQIGSAVPLQQSWARGTPFMDEIEVKRFEEACSKYEAGFRTEALQQLRELIAAIPDVEEQAGLLHFEILWLIDLAEISQARDRLIQLRRLVGNSRNPVPDTDSDDPRALLVVRTEFAEAKVLLFEGKRAEGNQILDNLVSFYPKQLARDSGLLGYIQLIRGQYLADHAKWVEAVSAFEQAVIPEDQKSLASYYLGHCHYALGRDDLAKQELEESLKVGLTAKWECRAHYMLGLTTFRLSDLKAAKKELELCVETADPEYLATTQIWKYLEETCRRLGLSTEAQKYRKMWVIPIGSASN